MFVCVCVCVCCETALLSGQGTSLLKVAGWIPAQDTLVLLHQVITWEAKAELSLSRLAV